MRTGGAHALLAASLVAAVSVAAGCAPVTLPTRFYVLSPLPGSGAAAPGPIRDLAVGVGPIAIPAYLDRPQLVTRTAQDEVALADFDQWAEPLRNAVSRILAENLAARLPTERVTTFPWRGSRSVQYQVAAEILRFEGTPAGDVVLRARWRLLDTRGRELVVRTSAVTEAADGPGYAPMAAALSRALASLSDEMATAITTAAR